MAKLSRLAGSTSHILEIFIQDSSATTGVGLTGLAYNTSGLTCYFKRNAGTASVAVTLVNITTLGTFVSGGFKEVDATNMPGVYEFHPPDTAYATGAKSVVLMLRGATNMSPVLMEIDLTAIDTQSTSLGLSLAKTTNITGFNDIAATAIVSSGAITTAGGKVSGVVLADGLTTNNDKTGYSLSQAFPTNFSSLGITSGGKISGVVLADTVTTYTGNTVQTGDNFARIGVAGAGLTALGDTRLAHLDADVSSRSTYAGGAVASVTAGVTVTTNNDKTGYSLSQAFPTNFAALGITSGGKISGVVLTDTITTYTGDTPQTGDLYAKVNPLITSGAFTTAAMANAPTGGGTSQTGDVFALLNPMITSHVFTTASLVNAPAGSGGGGGGGGGGTTSALPYVIAARDSSTTPPGMPVTGLTPTWVFLKKLSDGTSIGSPPSITEIGYGQYKIMYDPMVTGEASGQVDFGSSLPNPGDRKADVVFLKGDSTTAFYLDAAVSTRSTYAGGAVSTVTDKQGYSLSPTGLDSISTADPGGASGHNTLSKRINAIWRALWCANVVSPTQWQRLNDSAGVNSTATINNNTGTQTQTFGSFN